MAADERDVPGSGERVPSSPQGAYWDGLASQTTLREACVAYLLAVRVNVLSERSAQPLIAGHFAIIM